MSILIAHVCLEFSLTQRQLNQKYNGTAIPRHTLLNYPFFSFCFSNKSKIIFSVNNKKNCICVLSNGRSLGKAYEDFNADGGVQYFPALTLFNEESIHVNLGERQFKFPISGAKPVIANPIPLTDYFKRLELNMNALIDVQIGLKQNVRLWH